MHHIRPFSHLESDIICQCNCLSLNHIFMVEDLGSDYAKKKWNSVSYWQLILNASKIIGRSKIITIQAGSERSSGWKTQRVLMIW